MSPKEISGFVDNGRGEPAVDLPAVATILGTSTVVDTTITDDDGEWSFSGLPTADEYLVTLTDSAGNAVSRGPWSGEMRSLWVRDRLDVAGKPVVLDSLAGNALLWSSTGLYAPQAPVTDLSGYYTKTEADARYAELTDVDPFPQYLTVSEGNAAYATAAHNHDATYVQLVGGSVMTGLLGPSTHNTRDLGTTGTRWRALYGMTGDLTTSLTVATKPVAISPDGSNIIEWRANGFYAAAGAVTDIWVNTGGDTMTGDLNMTANILPTVTNVRSLGSTSLRWLKVWATDADFTNAPTVGGAALLTSTTADALFLTPTEGNAAYVGLAGGSVMTGLLGPTTTNTRDLGTTALRWRKLWAVDGEFTNAPTVGGVALPTVATADAAYVNVGGDTMTGILNINSPSADVLVLKGGVASDNTQLRFWGGASAVLQWAVGNNISTGGTGRLFQIYDAVGGASRLNIDSTGIVNALIALQVNSRPVIMAGCRVTHNTTQSIATSTAVALAFNTERYDTDAYHDTVTNNSRLTVPTGLAGKYHIWVNLQWTANADANYRQVRFRLNAATFIASMTGPALNSASIQTDQPFSTIYDLAAGDYVEVVVAQASGVALNILNTGNYSPEFGMQRIG